MSAPYIGIRAAPETERSVAGAFTGSAQNLGTPLTQNPIMAIFDNQSTVSVAVGFSGVSNWKTFSAGEALILDMRANHGQAQTFTFDLGTQFTVTATGGTGSFRLSILYAR